jgi:hypothetical protein
MHRQSMLTRLLQKRNHLFPTNTRKSLQKILNRIPRLQVVKKTFHRHTRASENQRPSQNLRILRNNLHIIKNLIPASQQSTFFIPIIEISIKNHAYSREQPPIGVNWSELE